MPRSIRRPVFAAWLLTGVLGACAPQEGRLSQPADAATIEQAAALEKKGDAVGAIRLYQQVVQRNPDAIGPRLTLAALLRKNGHAGEAESLMQDTVAKAPDNAKAQTQLGYAMIENNHPEEAIAVFDRLIARNPADASAYNGKGVAFDHAGNHLAAQDLYQYALKIEPDSPSVQNNLAMSMILNQQYDQAIGLLEKLDTAGGSVKIRQNLALAYGLSGNKARALAINQRDLTPEQVRENMRFYDEYPKKGEAHAKAASGIGFATTPEELRRVPEPKPAPEEVVAMPAASMPVKEAAPIIAPPPVANTTPVESMAVEKPPVPVLPVRPPEMPDVPEPVAAEPVLPMPAVGYQEPNATASGNLPLQPEPVVAEETAPSEKNGLSFTYPSQDGRR